MATKVAKFMAKCQKLKDSVSYYQIYNYDYHTYTRSEISFMCLLFDMSDFFPPTVRNLPIRGP